MDVRLTEEQQMVQRLAAELADAHAPATTARLADRGERAWVALLGSGLVGMQVPEAQGGAGASAVDVALVVEQLGRALVPVPYLGGGAWAPALLAAADAGALLADVVAGRRRLAPVLTEDLGGLARAGEPGVAIDADGAEQGVALGRDGRLVLVGLGPRSRSVDLTRVLRAVAPDAPSEVVGQPPGGDVLRRVEAMALALLAADLVGTMQGALDAAAAHVRDREQFGVPVGSFQAVQHLAAHGAVLVEGARSAMWHAAWAADALDPDGALLAGRQAKAAASAAAREVGETAIQLFGGIGLTWEHLAHVRQRRILLGRELLGSEGAHYRAIARARLGTAVGR